jgi:predicted transposase YdaD
MFFEKMFSRNDITTDFIKNYLPQSVVNTLDLTTLHLEKKSFIRTEIQGSYL